jgi:hypothetical protein
VANFQNLKAWQENLVEIEQLTRGPMRFGTRFREVRKVNGRVTENQAEVTAYEPNKRFETTTLTGTHVTAGYVFEPEEGGTRLQYKFEMVTRGTMRLLQGMLARAIKLQLDAELARLKGMLES